MQQVVARLGQLAGAERADVLDAAAVAEHHRSRAFDVGGFTAAQREQVSLLSTRCAEHDGRIDEPQSLGFDDAGQSPHEIEAVRARHHDELPGSSVRGQFLGDGLHLVVGAKAGDENVGVLHHFGQPRHRLGTTRRRGRESLLVDVVGDDVEATGDHVAGHRQSHIADTDDSDHVAAFPYENCTVGVGPKY